MRRHPLAHLNDDTGKFGQRVFEEYLALNPVDWTYECLPGNAQPDYVIDPKGANSIVEVKTIGWPGESRDEIDPCDPVRRKVKKARPQFTEYKDRPCALAIHSATMFGPQGPETILAAAFGPGIIPSRDYNLIDSSSTFYRFPEWSELPSELKHLSEPLLKSDSNTTFSALILFGYHAIDPLHLAVWRRLHAKQQAGLLVESGDQFNLLNELAPNFDRTKPPTRIPRVILIENRYARRPFPDGLFRGAFDQRWGWHGDWCGPVWIGSALDSLVQDGVPFYML